MAKEAGIANIQFIEASFGEILSDKKIDTEFDFIVLHGVYTWVSREVRKEIINIIKKLLKPGGIVYISYNTLPGWTPVMPLQRLIMEYAAQFPHRKSVKNMVEVLNKIELLEQRGFFKLNEEALKARLGKIKKQKTANIRYLVHEYMHTGWEPLYFCDVSRDMKEAKLEFICSCDLAFSFPALVNVDILQKLYQEEYSVEFKQLLMDFVFNTAFRKDIFGKGVPKITFSAAASALLKRKFMLTVPAKEIDTEFIIVPAGKLKPEAWFESLIKFIEQGPKPLNEIMQNLNINLYSTEFRALVRTLALLISQEKVATVSELPDREVQERARRLNMILKKIDDVFMVANILYLVSPFARTGVEFPVLHRQIAWEILGGRGASAEELVPYICNFVKQRKIRLEKEDNTPVQENELGNFVHEKCRDILENNLPIWKNLGIIV